MASFRSTLWTIWIALLLCLMVAGITFGWSWWGQRAIKQDLNEARARLNEGKPAEAELVLAERLDVDRPTGPWVDEALNLRFEALDQLAAKATDSKQKAQYLTTAQTVADRVLDAKKPWTKKGQPAWTRSHLVLAQAAIQAGKADAAQPHIQAVLELPEGSPGREEAILDRARLRMANNEVTVAQKELDELLAKLPNDARIRPGVEKALGLCNMAILKSQTVGEGDEIYTIQKGDTLEGIKKRFKVSPEVLQGINGLNPHRLTIGRRIKIPNLQFAIIVNKADNTLTLYNHGKFFKKYTVRTGKQDYMTPVGDFKVVNKMKDPRWTNPREGKSYGPGEPGNELGCRWIGFQGVNLGIHEAADPSTIGQYSSNGCVGMLKDDVIELFDLVPYSTPVKIINDKAGAPTSFPMPASLSAEVAGAVEEPAAEEAGAAAAGTPKVTAAKKTSGAAKKASAGSRSSSKTSKTSSKTKKNND